MSWEYETGGRHQYYNILPNIQLHTALYSDEFDIEFLAPEYTFTEILKHADIIEKKAKLASKDLRYVIDMLFSRITIYPKEEYADCYMQAKEIMKDIDPDDAPFFGAGDEN